MILAASLRYGIIVMLVFKVTDEIFCTFVNGWPAGKLIGLRLTEQFRIMLPPFLASALMGALVYGMNFLGLKPLAALLLEIPAGVVSYVLLSLILNRETLFRAAALLRARRRPAE